MRISVAALWPRFQRVDIPSQAPPGHGTSAGHTSTCYNPSLWQPDPQNARSKMAAPNRAAVFCLKMFERISLISGSAAKSRCQAPLIGIVSGQKQHETTAQMNLVGEACLFQATKIVGSSPVETCQEKASHKVHHMTGHQFVSRPSLTQSDIPFAVDSEATLSILLRHQKCQRSKLWKHYQSATLEICIMTCDQHYSLSAYGDPLLVQPSRAGFAQFQDIQTRISKTRPLSHLISCGSGSGQSGQGFLRC